ncbi:hypothetical protein [Peribacillus muralis]|uniref:hypothetical protein n=1 Tax=Peribacillus muralis TaxID=264697 RepID=UPI003D08C44C
MKLITNYLYLEKNIVSLIDEDSSGTPSFRWRFSFFMSWDIHRSAKNVEDG